MSQSRIPGTVVGRLIGLVLVLGAIAAVVFVDWQPAVEPTPEPIRPLKTMKISSAQTAAVRNYPGRVRASKEVRLAFQVAGPLIELNVKKGDKVSAGDVLAKIDPRDFASALQSKEAVLAKAKEDYEKIERLFNDGHAGKQELTDYKAAYEVAQADADVARKALEDTQLVAPFSGVIADKFVDNFQNIAAKQAVLSLQDVTSVDIDVSVPEERVIRAQDADRGQYRFVAVFDYLPGREFDAELKEFTTEADPVTQTYTATFSMPAPQDVKVLPGMTVTIREFRKNSDPNAPASFTLPVDAVPIDEPTGTYSVWKVNVSPDGTGTVHRQKVSVGEMVGDDIVVTDGIAPGDQIALAGVYVLKEGQKVKPFLATEQSGTTP
jgi:multidrug efflux system membrane fusion protein